MMAVVGVLAVAALAVAQGVTVGIGTAEVKAHKETVAVNSRGVTVYELGPESAGTWSASRRRASACGRRSRPRASWSRSPGSRASWARSSARATQQVTLDGHPIYTFTEDAGRRGKAEGDGINNFGGVWHVFKES